MDSPQRIMAAIKHVLAASREFGHCYLTQSQIRVQVNELIELDLGDRLPDLLENMEQENLVMVREIETQSGAIEACYYSKSLYFDELYVARIIQNMGTPPRVDGKRVERWISLYCQSKGISLSKEQAAAIKGIVGQRLSILTGGPGCGKTTATLVFHGQKTRCIGRNPQGAGHGGEKSGYQPKTDPSESALAGRHSYR
jgi:exodeoxyribonuclease V alpha subunit